MLVIFGATGVGKTRLIEQLFAERFNLSVELISADALQIYRQLDIGTAKPPARLLARIPHHLIDICDYTTPFSVGDFCKRSDRIVSDILERGKLPLITGGCAYYLKSWLLGMPKTPPTDIGLRRQIIKRWKDKSNQTVRNELHRLDPISASRIEVGDRYRLLRALEVYEQSGRPLSSFVSSNTSRDDYQILLIGLRRDRSELCRFIDSRVDEMLRTGLENEIRRLIKDGAHSENPGMKGIGYREWFGPNGSILESKDAKKLIARNTRRYAKRQNTFFASIPKVIWFELHGNGDCPPRLMETLRRFLCAPALEACLT
ncbi:tRNA dimethylallyltransferase [Olavius algarvensis spirochete endosymbiont]|uniref:tRNA (adenosine(37)-N6)-dimethylallyltransferase MiaA n=1 Tax=Olavius algarvensis spirochete endosymbiont TaxID=260710 RepID=UPI000F0FB253|nr:tRNA (adenosine(37)-N6)-dimethylallyltransferase MiaA [Olavius algarvensis spirochete endosymbiont]CAD7839179.1 MAG: tRNA dimethylallyltransferase (EC 2.5.1.75) [Olavius algarvensis spirochete endosymbiont]VDA99176.1 tRNA dimethylallyltransferase [Olavius algarvensis spirochete endosymbiont]